jgi:hypothetical protein
VPTLCWPSTMGWHQAREVVRDEKRVRIEGTRARMRRFA